MATLKEQLLDKIARKEMRVGVVGLGYVGLPLAVEKAKIDLSADQTAAARKAEIVPERHLSLEEEIDRATFEKIIMPLVVGRPLAGLS